MSERGARTTLTDVLAAAQRLGTLGSAPIPQVIERAQRFLPALEKVTGIVVDLGSGAGVPGLVIANARPDLSLVLVERRESRADALTRAVHGLGMAQRVTVRCDDASRVALDPELHRRCSAVVSRGFGPPTELLPIAREFLTIGGVMAVAEPPAVDENRWPSDLLGHLGFSKPLYLQGIAMFHVEH